MTRYKAQTRYDEYILQSIDLWEYDLPCAKTDAEKVLLLKQVFLTEYGWHVKRYGNFTRSLEEWLRGLPTAINIDFYNHDILKRAVKYGALPENASEKQEDVFLDKYWKYMSMRLSSLMDRAAKAVES